MLLCACGARSGLELWSSLAGAGGEAQLGGATGKSGAGGGDSSGGDGSGGATVNGGADTGGALATGGGGASGGAAAAGSGALGGSGGGVACPGGGSVEVCNGIDDDCDGEIDEDLPLEIVDGPIVVRNDEGSTAVGSSGSCISCAWAWHPQLIAPQDQLGVVWYLGIDGGHEQPSGFGRPLSWELEPQGAVSSLGPQFWLEALRRGDTVMRGSLLALVQRVGASDRASFAFVASDFKASDSIPLPGCTGPSAGFSVAALLPGLMSCVMDNVFRLFVVDEQQARVVTSFEQDVQAPGSPVMYSGSAVGALNGGRGLVAFPIVHPSGNGNLLWTLEIAAAGPPLAVPRRQALEGTSAPVFDALIARPGGYLLLGHEGFGAPTPGRFTAVLDLEGQRVGAVAHYDQGFTGYDEASVIRVGTGSVVAGTAADGILIEQLDSTGGLIRQQLLRVPAYSASSLLFAHGHLYLAYAESPDFTIAANRILVARMSCAR